MKTHTLGVIAIVAFLQVAAKQAGEGTFWVYQDMSSRHYTPAGWMGDFGDLRFNQNWKKDPASGTSCIKITYSAERKQGAGWAGIYWQDPANNWGDKKGGYDLKGFKTLKFKARGETGQEQIDKFQVGGITGQEEIGDSDAADTGSFQLTKEWKEYVIPLDKMDLSNIVGGFCFVLNSDANSNGATFYLDDIRYER